VQVQALHTETDKALKLKKRKRTSSRRVEEGKSPMSFLSFQSHGNSELK